MTTLLYVFIVALFLALVLTPTVRKIALHFNVVHQPSERCIHDKPIPRIGGVALFLSFILALLLCLPFQTNVSILLQDSKIHILFLTAGIIFILGLIDDFYHLPSSVKFLVQILAGIIAWYGGIQINVLSLSLSSGTELGWLSLPITVFWIVLVTNAINLIDGLDGLAAGICFFSTLIMLLLCVSTGKILLALCFAALAGSLLGFLRYNFNPASIFMGDSGSYFLGYTFATLSVLGSVKGQATLAMLIPFIVMGVPLFDAVISPMRRFARGKKLFSPDQKHLHHRLIQNGYSQKKAVLFLYSGTLILGLSAFTLTLVKDEKAALILFVPAVALFIAFKKLGYLNYFAIDKLYGWLRDMTETSHISHGSRTFLDHQMIIRNAKTIDEMWSATQQAFAFLEIDQAILNLATYSNNEDKQPVNSEWVYSSNEDVINVKQIEKTKDKHHFKIEFPLLQLNNRQDNQTSIQETYLGTLAIYKDVSSSPIKQFTIRRIEQLKRDLVDKLPELSA